MEIILLQDVKNIGQRGDVVKVRDGYGRNHLVPRKLAMIATRDNRDFVEQQRVRAEKRKAKDRAVWQEKAQKLTDQKFIIEAQSGENGKLFGSVTSADIAQALTRQGHEIDKKCVQLKAPIRKLGVFAVTLDLFSGVKANISVEIVEKV